MRRDVNRDEVVRLYVHEKQSTVQIGKAFGLWPGAIRSILVRRGVKMRSPKAALKILWPKGRWGKDASHWKGGRIRGGAGYVYIHTPDHPHANEQGYVMEHRLVMEQKLGRRLKRKEVVHHINGVKTDNRPENLGLKRSIGHHVSDHFKDGHKAHELEARVGQLEAENAALKAQLRTAGFAFA